MNDVIMKIFIKYQFGIKKIRSVVNTMTIFIIFDEVCSNIDYSAECSFRSNDLKSKKKVFKYNWLVWFPTHTLVEYVFSWKHWKNWKWIIFASVDDIYKCGTMTSTLEFILSFSIYVVNLKSKIDVYKKYSECSAS